MKIYEIIMEQDPAFDDGAGQLGQNPMMQKVNAYTANITDLDAKAYMLNSRQLCHQKMREP